MEPYTVEGIAKREAEQRKSAAQPESAAASSNEAGPTEAESTEAESTEAGSGETTSTEEAIKPVAEPTAPIEAANAPGSYLYQLSGVVVHQGVANAGHYYSFVRVLDPMSPAYGKWLKLNDHEVEEVVLSDAMMEKEFFGGKYWAESQVSSYSTESERYWNAYMLFYERIKPTEPAEPASAPFDFFCHDGSISHYFSAAAPVGLESIKEVSDTVSGSESSQGSTSNLIARLESIALVCHAYS
jgi:ubiquitin carboxyl-terminal hydrolase 9/24